MVAITPEEVIEQRRLKSETDELSEADRQTLGTFIRFEIPLSDISRLRSVGELLRRYADKIDAITRRSDMPIRTMLLELRFEGVQITKAIKTLYPDVFKRRWYSHRDQ
jgi:hypothetical protein